MSKSHLLPIFSPLPVCFQKGEGVWLTDTQGNVYLDGFAGIAVNAVGHNHPRLVSALQKQVSELIHVSNYFRIDLQEEVAAKLCEKSGLRGCFFCNSGLEANEAAIKLARKYGHLKGFNEPKIIVFDHAFHGRSIATLSATGNPNVRRDFAPYLPDFIRVPAGDVEMIEKLATTTPGICAVMFECIQGEAGVRPLSVAFLQALEELAHTHDALLIVDEVQTGLFRCSKPFSFQISGIRPDIVTIAKGVANGLPMGVCCARGVIADAFRPGDNGTTFGGGPVAMVAARQTLELLQNPTLASHVESTGRYLRAALAELPFVEEVRGKGLMVAAKVTPGLSAKQLVRDALDYGVLLNATDDETLRFLPPLICEKAHIDVLAQALRATVNKIREPEAN